MHRRLSFLCTADLALWVQISYVATLRARCRINDAVDERRLPGSERFLQSFGESFGIGDMMAGTAESLDEFVITSVLHQNGWSRISTATSIHVVAAINPTIVKNNGDDGQGVAADGLNFHAAETEGAIALDGDDRFTGSHSRSNGVTHADSHHAPGPGIETLARL